MSVYTKGCLFRTTTRPNEINAADLRLVSGAAVANGANWNLPFTLTPRKVGGDIDTFVSCASVDLFTSTTATVPTASLTAPSTGLPNALTTTFNNIAKNAGNTANTWRIRYVNLQVRGRGGNNFTIPSIEVQVPSPFTS
jgi:hypothetical protein